MSLLRTIRWFLMLAVVTIMFERSCGLKLLAGLPKALARTNSMLSEKEVPDSRRSLLPSLASHAKALVDSLDQIETPHEAASVRLAGWIAENYKPGQPLDVICVCTGNSRRSILGATWGNVAAAYWGLPEVRFHSGGTEPSAFNARTIATLRAIGLEIEPTGEEAVKGPEGSANPVYQVRWGVRSGDSAGETLEFSKRFDDPGLPKSGFVALMVCGEADEACPFVPGAALRIPIPYQDPKAFDGLPEEAEKYNERRDDIGRWMLGMLAQTRLQLTEKGR